MARTLMIVPANDSFDVASITQSFFKIIQEEEIPVEFFVPIQQGGDVPKTSRMVK